MDDTISRTAVLDAVDGVDWYHQNQHGEMVHGANSDRHQAWYKAEDIYTAIESVQSAQPDHIGEVTEMVGDVVSRQGVLRLLNAAPSEEFATKAMLISGVNALPSAQPEFDKQELIRTITTGIISTNTEDVYSCGMRNGMRWCKYLIDGKKPLFENCPSAEPEQRNARVFQGIIVEYPSIGAYPEYEGKPYFSIKYTENGQEFIGYGTYKPEVLSEYLKEYFMPPAQPGWTYIKEELPKTIINQHTHDYQEYNCLCDFGDNGFDIRTYKFGNGHFWNGGGIVDKYVTAWQPLPEIPDALKHPWEGGQDG